MADTLLPTSVIGSYALPSWLWLAREAMATGRYGPSDIRETLEDATRMAIADQIEAGVDMISDGEMRRVNFILGFYDHIRGLETLPPARQVGAPHWDTETPLRAVERLTAPDGLGIVDDFRLARGLTDEALKATCPGPVTLSIPIRRGEVYATRIRRALEYVTPEKLVIVPDCGFWETPRWIARGKLQAMVAGTRMVRQELQAKG